MYNEMFIHPTFKNFTDFLSVSQMLVSQQDQTVKVSTSVCLLSRGEGGNETRTKQINTHMPNSDKWHEAIKWTDRMERASPGDNIKLSGLSTSNWVLCGRQEPASLVNICGRKFYLRGTVGTKHLRQLLLRCPISQILILLLFDHGHWRYDISSMRLYKKINHSLVFLWMANTTLKVICLPTFNNL